MWQKFSKSLVAVILLSMLVTCKNPFGPNQSRLQGRITDNNRNPVVGAKVSAKRVDDSSEGEYVSSEQSTTTDSLGYYLIDKVEMGRIKLNITKMGLMEATHTIDISQVGSWNCQKPQLKQNLQMEGAPTLSNPSVVPDSASASAGDSIQVSVWLMDGYAIDLYTSPDVRVSTFDSEGRILETYRLVSTGDGPSGLFRITLYANNFEPGTYTLEFFAIDTDGNNSNKIPARLVVIP